MGTDITSPLGLLSCDSESSSVDDVPCDSESSSADDVSSD